MFTIENGEKRVESEAGPALWSGVLREIIIMNIGNLLDTLQATSTARIMVYHC
ncbi:MAG: hypothetical protein OXM02_04895 [Bacteroidota bacterium]|nr:hypothetical protein [Bacteroidota bacterium]